MTIKISALTASTTAPVDTDVIPTDESMGGTPATKRKAWSIFKAAIKAMTFDGWISADQSWAYASATTITVPSGAAAIYAVGDKLKWTANSVVLYAYVISIADTVLTVIGNPVTDFAITANYYSKSTSPVGFPHWFAYTPTGVSAANATLTGRFALLGRLCTVQFHAAMSGAITFTTMPTLPIAASAGIISTLGASGVATSRDATGPAILHNGLIPCVVASATTLNLVKPDGTAMSASVPITWASGDYIDAEFQYEI
jgi:hypothetical protein